MKLYRAGLVGLPLQCSMFADINCAPAIIGQHGILRDDVLGASLTETGDLYLDRADIDLLASAISTDMSTEVLDRMTSALSDACSTLRAAAGACTANAHAATSDDALGLLGDIGNALRHFVPFAILSKFVPDVLYREYALSMKSGVPKLAGDSQGASLTRELFALFTDCVENGFSPDRLLEEWPRVPEKIADRLIQFCERNSGFGPLPWEAAGYEDPRYVIGVMGANFAGSDKVQLTKGLEGRALRGPATDAESDRAAPPSDLQALRRTIIAWMDFLDRETWYVRRAFYLGIVPLLSRLLPHYQVKSPELKLDDLLFFEIDELLTDDVAEDVAYARRASYFGRAEYVCEHRVTTERLAAVFATYRVPLAKTAGTGELAT